MAGAHAAAAIAIPPPTPANHRSAGAAQGPRCQVGAHTLASFGKGTSENQDTFVATASESGSKTFVGVFDGHGEKGGRVSSFVRDTLCRSLLEHRDLHADPRGALEGAYHDTQRQIEREHGTEAALSGTTAVAAYQHRDRLLVANVGDSRAVLGRCDTARPHRLRALDLSEDHKPNRADERHRIERAGGVVDQMAFPVFNNGTIRWIRGGPERVMDRSGMGGLAMSRSLGDLSLRPFVSAQPELVERRLDGRDRLLVLGSDGVWDQVSSQEAVEIAGRHGDPSSAAREITGVARRRWQASTDGLLSDDITAVVLRLGGTSRPGSPEAEVPPRRAEAPRGEARGDLPRGERRASAAGRAGRGRSEALPRRRTLPATPQPELMPPAGRRTGAQR